MRLKKLKFLILLIMGGLLLASAAWAAGVNVHCTGAGGSGYGHDRDGTTPGDRLDTSSVIQWIIGNPGAPDDRDRDLLHSGALNSRFSGHIGDGTGGVAGTFDINTDIATNNSYLRIWENGGPARGSWYTTLGNFASGDPIPLDHNIPNFNTNFLADVPAEPTVTAGGFRLTWDAGRSTYLVAFSLTPHRGTSPNVEVVNYTIDVIPLGGDWSAARSQTGLTGAWSITEDPASPFFIAGQRYVARCTAHNWLGFTPGPDYEFEIPAGGGPSGVLVTDFALVHPADTLGVNVITFPFSSVSDPGAIATAQDLIEAVNNVPGSNVVTTLSWWDSASQAPAGYIVTYADATVNNFGTITAIGLADADPDVQTMSRDMAYQIYVTENVDLRLIGAR